MENRHFLNETELLKIDPVTRAIVRNEIGYEGRRQPTNDYDTTAELNAQLDLLHDALAMVAPRARRLSQPATVKPLRRIVPKAT